MVSKSREGGGGPICCKYRIMLTLWAAASTYCKRNRGCRGVYHKRQAAIQSIALQAPGQQLPSSWRHCCPKVPQSSLGIRVPADGCDLTVRRRWASRAYQILVHYVANRWSNSENKGGAWRILLQTWPCVEPGVGLSDPWGSFPTWDILCFYDPTQVGSTPQVRVRQLPSWDGGALTPSASLGWPPGKTR